METKDLKIGIIGNGFIGSAMSEDFIERGFNVIQYSLDKKYIKNKDKIKLCTITFIAVPTPTTPKGFDYSIVEKVLPLIGNGKIAVIKSTILPGTTRKLQAKFPEIVVLHSPEFLTARTAKKDAKFPNRNIIGYSYSIIGSNGELNSYEAAKLVMSILPPAPYKAIVEAEEAEMIKYTGNCWFYFKIIYLNLIYDLCKKLGIEYERVKEGISFDPRIGFTHLDMVHQGGRGGGGACFIKDMATFKSLYYEKLRYDKTGNKLLEYIEKKNIELLLDSKKDLELLKGVYGDDIIK